MLISPFSQRGIGIFSWKTGGGNAKRPVSVSGVWHIIWRQEWGDGVNMPKARQKAVF